MQGWPCLLGVSAVLFGVVTTANAAETFDNPAMGTTPCVILKSYQASSDGADAYGAQAIVENVCGRSVEIAFCFPFVSPADDAAEPHCTNGLIRPWATSEVEVSGLPARLAGPNYQWRWHGPTME